MRRLFYLPLLLLWFASSSVKAEEFYVELGRADSEVQAQEFFTDLQARNKALVDYDVFPNAILQEDGSLIYRIQAGPMLDKEEARKVCNRLRRTKTACFIIEGFDPQRPSSFAKAAPLKSKDFVPPWLQKEPEVPAPPSAPASEESSSIGSFFDSITSVFDSDTADTKAETVDKKEPRAAEVSVAEAIPVALSSDMQSSETVTVGAPVVIAEEAATTPATAGSPGWLNVQPFIDGDRAERFWRELKNRAQSDAGGLSMKVVVPVVKQDIPTVIANIGRFASEADANRFCKNHVVPASRYLECRFSTTPPDSEPMPVPAHIAANAEEERSLYWVEMLTAKSQDAALSQWERIRTDHDDLLSDVRSQITTSLAKPGVYVVRVGPVNARSKATALCNALQKRKLACKVVGL